MNILHLCPTFGNLTCGIAKYSERLYAGIKEHHPDAAQQVYSGSLTGVHSLLLQKRPDVVHFQFEYGFCSWERLELIADHCLNLDIQLFITFHSLATVRHNTVGSRQNVHRLTHAPGRISEKYIQHPQQIISPVPIIKPTNHLGIYVPYPDSYLFFGQAHPHKNLMPMLSWFARNPKKHLVVIASKGNAVNNYWQECRDRAMYLPNVLWIDEYLEESDVLGVADQCAAVILPYLEFGTVGVSAAAKLFLSLNLPILLTNSTHFCDIPSDARIVTKRDTLEDLLELDLRECRYSDRKMYVQQMSVKHSVDQHYNMYKTSVSLKYAR